MCLRHAAEYLDATGDRCQSESCNFVLVRLEFTGSGPSIDDPIDFIRGLEGMLDRSRGQDIEIIDKSATEVTWRGTYRTTPTLAHLLTLDEDADFCPEGTCEHCWGWRPVEWVIYPDKPNEEGWRRKII